MRESKPVTNKAESLYETATDDGSVKDQLLGLAVNQVIWEETFNNIKIIHSDRVLVYLPSNLENTTELFEQERKSSLEREI